MLTKKDIKVISELFDSRFQEIYGILEDQRLWFSNQTAQFKDDILKELIPLRLDYDILARKVGEHTETLENHENRLAELETVQ